MLKKKNNRKFPLPWEVGTAKCLWIAGKNVLKEGVNKTTEAHKRRRHTSVSKEHKVDTSVKYSYYAALRRTTPEEFESGGRFNIQVNALNVFCPHDAGRI